MVTNISRYNFWRKHEMYKMDHGYNTFSMHIKKHIQTN